MSDYDDIDDPMLDDDEAEDAEQGGSVELEEESGLSDEDLAEAETLTITAKQKQRDALASEVEAFLARGGKITELPADDSAKD